MNLLFDLDGTLTNPFPGITNCILYALDKLDRPLPRAERLSWCIGPPLKESFAKLLASDDEALVGRALGFYRERFGAVGLFENEVYDGIPEALTVLRTKGHCLYVATSKPTIYAERIIDHFKLRHFFKQVYGSELDGTRSDKEHLIAHILKEASIPVSDVAMVGDRSYDMLGAGKNGVNGFGVLWGYGTQDELVGAGARSVIKSPQGLTTTRFHTKRG